MNSAIRDSQASDGISDDEALRGLQWETAYIETLWNRYAQRIYRYFARRVGPVAAEELLSEVFVAALDSRRRVVPHESGSALPWLYGIASNVARHHLRAENGPLPAVLDDTTGIDWASVDARLDANSQRKHLRAALEILTEVDRELILLVAWEGLVPKEAAKALGITALAARGRLHRARRRAQQALASALRDEPAATVRMADEARESR